MSHPISKPSLLNSFNPFKTLNAFALASTFAMLAGCAIAPSASDAESSASTEEALLPIHFPLGCIGQITGAPIYRDSGFQAGKDGPYIATVRATLPACAYREWTSIWVQPIVTTITGQTVSENIDLIPLTAGQPLEETVSGLSPTTVYKINLDLYTIASGQFTKVGTTADFYTITDGTDNGSRARSTIVLHGLKQYDDQQKGLVGKGGVQPDGTRYDASPGELWCSEFYAWVTSARLTTSSYVQKSVGMVQAYFAVIGPDAWDTNKNAIRNGHPGDYMSLGGHHSTMFLGYDAASDVVYTLEGNVDDKVALSSHARTEMDGIGKITNIMIR